MTAVGDARKRQSAAQVPDVEGLAEVIARSLDDILGGNHEGWAHDVELAVLSSPWFAARLAAEREKALREAADAWTQGQWSDVMLPKPTPPAIPVIAYSNRFGDWLRARADLEGQR